MADWLNTFFASYDHTLAAAMHGVQTAFGNVFFNLFSLTSKGGIPLILTGLILLLFQKTRSVGFRMLFAIAVGAIFTNLLIKPLVARPRPYFTEGTDYYDWWLAAGAQTESEYSFPSGHSTASMATAIALFFSLPKKWSWAFFFYPLVMGMARVYLMVHFASDVLFGFLFGAVGGVLGVLAANGIMRLFKGKVKTFWQEWSIVRLFRKKQDS